MDFLAKPSIDPKPLARQTLWSKGVERTCLVQKSDQRFAIDSIDGWKNVGCAEKTWKNNKRPRIFFRTTTTKKKENNKMMRKNKQPYIHTAYIILVRCCDFTNDAPRLWKNTLCGTGRLTQGPKEWDVLPSVEGRWDELSIRPPEKNERLKTLNRNDGTWFISDLFLLPL